MAIYYIRKGGEYQVFENRKIIDCGSEEVACALVRLMNLNLMKKGEKIMKVQSRLVFLEAKYKDRFDGSGSYPVVVFYDNTSEQLVKPFLNDGEFEQIKLLEPYSICDVQLEIYDGKNGMVVRLDKIISNKDLKKA